MKSWPNKGPPVKALIKEVEQKVVVKSQEVLQTFEAGQIIFSQGDQGGDLLFIESGSVEIFISKNTQEISLAQMSAGEIIGVMTFLTRDLRLASARATEATRIKRIPSQHVQRYIASFPRWLTIVLKEFVGRINEMNRMYSEVAIEVKKAREMQITPLFLATQMAQAMAIVAKGIVRAHDGVEYVLIDELSEKIQLVLNQPKDMIDGLLAVFDKSALLKTELEPERKRKVYSLTTLQNVAIFTQFVRESSLGSARKLLKARLTNLELRMIYATAKYTEKKAPVGEKSTTMPLKDLVENLFDATGIAFDPKVLAKPVKLGLMTLSEEGEQGTVTMTPAVVMQTLSCMQAMRRLSDEPFEPSDSLADAPQELRSAKAAA